MATKHIEQTRAVDLTLKPRLPAEPEDDGCWAHAFERAADDWVDNDDPVLPTLCPKGM